MIGFKLIFMFKVTNFTMEAWLRQKEAGQDVTWGDVLTEDRYGINKCWAELGHADWQRAAFVSGRVDLLSIEEKSTTV